MKITEEDFKRRKNMIINQAFCLFCQKGIDEVTMKEIAMASQVGVASVFRYFRTKTGVLLETQKLYWSEIIKHLSQAILCDEYEQKSGYEQIRALLDAFERLYQEHEDYLLFAAKFKIYMARNKSKADKWDYIQLLNPICQMFCQAMEKGWQDGSITVQGNLEDIFYTMWGVMRCFMEEIVVYKEMTVDKNQWEGRFVFVKTMILNTLNENVRIDVFKK